MSSLFISTKPSENWKQYLKTFNLKDSEEGFSDLSNGVIFAQVLNQIAPEWFDDSWMSKIKPDTGSNWRLKTSNLKKILQGITDFYLEILEQKISGFKLPNITSISEHNDVEELGRLIQLILGCAINCQHKQEYIETIMELEESVQHAVMSAIQELMNKETVSAGGGDSMNEIGDQLKRATEEIRIVLEEKEQIMQRCHELDLQVSLLQDEKSMLAIENEKFLEKLNRTDYLEDTSSAAGRRYQHLQNQTEVMQEDLYKLESSRDEHRVKVEIHEKTISDLHQKNDELLKLADQAQLLKDEIDILRHTSDKVEKYELTIESYKKKLEDMSELRRQFKALEDKNTMYLQQNVELEEEVRRLQSFKSQIDLYKKQVQELHLKVSDETRKSDKAEFELKRVLEKISTLQQEKERLIIERDLLKENAEELNLALLQNGTARADDSPQRTSSSVADSEMLETIPPEIKEKLIRLQHEVKMLKLKHNNDHTQEMMKTMLNDSKSRQNELESEKRIANQRILELESQMKDIQNLPTTNSESNHSGRGTTEDKQLMELDEKCRNLEDALYAKEDEMITMEKKYQKYMEKAKNVIITLDPKQNPGAAPEVSALRNQLVEKNKIIENLEKEYRKEKQSRDNEEKLMKTALYNVSMQLQRKAVEDRMNSLNHEPTAFLGRQRQSSTRKFNVPGIGNRKTLMINLHFYNCNSSRGN
ncbi:Protein Hook [Nymphon striatum]|nr:Protein Hook [Nymphon striatum]